MFSKRISVVFLTATIFLFVGGYRSALSATVDNSSIWPTINSGSGLGLIGEPSKSSKDRYINLGPITWDGGSADSYLDLDSLTFDNGNIEIISLKNFPNDRLLKSVPYTSETNKINIDCGGRRFRILDGVKYTNSFANGSVVESNNFALQGFAKWSEVKPNTLMDRILNSSCYLAEKRR